MIKFESEIIKTALYNFVLCETINTNNITPQKKPKIVFLGLNLPLIHVIYHVETESDLQGFFLTSKNMIFSILFEVREKTWNDGVVWTSDSVSAWSITYSRVAQNPEETILIFFMELCNILNKIQISTLAEILQKLFFIIYSN